DEAAPYTLDRAVRNAYCGFLAASVIALHRLLAAHLSEVCGTRTYLVHASSMTQKQMMKEKIDASRTRTFLRPNRNRVVTDRSRCRRLSSIQEVRKAVTAHPSSCSADCHDSEEYRDRRRNSAGPLRAR